MIESNLSMPWFSFCKVITASKQRLSINKARSLRHNSSTCENTQNTRGCVCIWYHDQREEPLAKVIYTQFYIHYIYFVDTVLIREKMKIPVSSIIGCNNISFQSGCVITHNCTKSRQQTAGNWGKVSDFAAGMPPEQQRRRRPHLRRQWRPPLRCRHLFKLFKFIKNKTDQNIMRVRKGSGIWFV